MFKILNHILIKQEGKNKKNRISDYLLDSDNRLTQLDDVKISDRLNSIYGNEQFDLRKFRGNIKDQSQEGKS